MHMECLEGSPICHFCQKIQTLQMLVRSVFNGRKEEEKAATDLIDQEEDLDDADFSFMSQQTVDTWATKSEGSWSRIMNLATFYDIPNCYKFTTERLLLQFYMLIRIPWIIFSVGWLSITLLSWNLLPCFSSHLLHTLTLMVSLCQALHPHPFPVLTC